MDQQRRIPPSPLLDDFYEILQSTRNNNTNNNNTNNNNNNNNNNNGNISIIPALKMEPEFGDFSWGAIPQQQQQQQLFYNDTSFGTVPGPVPDQFATGTQIQALRDFMVYGSTVPAGSFYNAEEATAAAVVSGEGPGIPSLAYRALCNEIYGSAGVTERSPHRSQFQRENHILAERQRREEMNEKFSALRAMIPKATKKDKASIVGDTIDYVLELEKRLKQLQACKENTAAFKAAKKRRCDDGHGNGASSSETTMNTMSNNNLQSLHGHGDHSVVSSPSDQITAESKLQLGKMKEVATTEVDVQQLGTQAVVKVVCNKRPGHVLHVLNALEECKVEVLQSNVMTVADNSIHFVTIQLEEGVSVPTEELVSAVLQAINCVEA